jgi:hypothetical protein
MPPHPRPPLGFFRSPWSINFWKVMSLVMKAVPDSPAKWLVPWRTLWIAICAAATAAGSSSVNAHPVSLSSAILEISDNQVRVDFQIMIEDLVLYHSLSSDGEMTYRAEDLLAAAEKHQQFLLEFFRIIDGQGRRLSGSVEERDFEQIQSGSIHQRELMERTIGFTIAYPLHSPRPEFLTLLQNFGGDDSSLPALMDVHILRNGMFEESAQLAFGRAHTVRFDWSRESTGQRESLSELRSRRREQFQSRLGITSYSGLYSFLYITPYSVRHEILIPLTTLEQWVSLDRREPDFLEVDEQIEARQSIQDFFLEHNRVTIDGRSVEGRVERLNFFGLDINDFAMNADARRVNMHQARLGVILNYPTSEVPSKVEVAWEVFSDFAQFIDTVLLIGNEKPDRFYFHPKATRYYWEGDLEKTIVQPVSSDLKLSDPEQRTQVLTGILGNIYKAFDFREDEEVYDALATSLKGDLLREVYLRIKRSLLMTEHGGELSHATRVEVANVEPSQRSAGLYKTTWRVASTTEHWGHIHRRLTEYQADLGVVAQDGAWKLEQFQLHDEKRLQFDTSIRGYDSNR